MNEDYGDYTDIQDGRDFVIEAVEADIAGRKGIKCNLTPRVKTTPLTDDASSVNTWLEEQPDILAINKHHTYESLNEIFQKWANPEEETEEPIVAKDEEEEEAGDLPWEKKQEQNFNLQAKQSKADKFNDLFND
jgi:hypothetical protein